RRRPASTCERRGSVATTARARTLSAAVPVVGAIGPIADVGCDADPGVAAEVSATPTAIAITAAAPTAIPCLRLDMTPHLIGTDIRPDAERRVALGQICRDR